MIQIQEWIRERMRSAQEMPAGQLINTFRESLKIEENPLSGIYEAEILRRLWVLETAIPTFKKEKVSPEGA